MEKYTISSSFQTMYKLLNLETREDRTIHNFLSILSLSLHTYCACNVSLKVCSAGIKESEKECERQSKWERWIIPSRVECGRPGRGDQWRGESERALGRISGVWAWKRMKHTCEAAVCVCVWFECER